MLCISIPAQSFRLPKSFPFGLNFYIQITNLSLNLSQVMTTLLICSNALPNTDFTLRKYFRVL